MAYGAAGIGMGTRFLLTQESKVPDSVKQKASTELVGGIPFMSDADLKTAMKQGGASETVTKAALDANAEARIAGLHTALAVLAIIACLAIVLAQRLPTKPIGGGTEAATTEAAAAPETAA